MVKIVFFEKILTFCSAATFQTPKSQLKVERTKIIMSKIAFFQKFLIFCSAATFQTPKSQLKVESNKKRGFEISRKNIERKFKTMWKLKWKKQWIEKHFTEKDKFGHCDMHRTYHEKDVIGDVVFEDYNKALYLAKSMSEFTKIKHDVITA